MITAEVIHRGERACFIPSLDRIELPEPDAFITPEAYFSTRAHETVHWIKTQKRLNRDFGAARFGDEGYAMEELVAELGAVFTMAQLGHRPAIREDRALYIAVWLKVLKRDSKAILTAAAGERRRAGLKLLLKEKKILANETGARVAGCYRGVPGGSD